MTVVSTISQSENLKGIQSNDTPINVVSCLNRMGKNLEIENGRIKRSNDNQIEQRFYHPVSASSQRDENVVSDP